MMIKYFVSTSFSSFYPIEVFFGLLRFNSQVLALPKVQHYHGEWGHPFSTRLMEKEEHPFPERIDTVWLSIVEKKFYSLESELPVNKLILLFTLKDKMSDEPLFEYIIVGMAPYGGVALWSYGFKKSSLLIWMYGETTQVRMKDFSPLNPTVTLADYCKLFLDNDPILKQNLETNGLPPRDLFDNYMKQFTYRYLSLFEHWNEDEEKWQPYTEEEKETKPELDYIEEALYDGTHDKLHDGGLLNYHEAGKPKKLAVKWHIKKSEYMAYFWFEDEDIRAFFDRFYGIHPDTNTDFIIHVDPITNKYQLALFRYGLQEPKIIPEDAYQLIVFKNKFEHFRSENYDQPRGAWIW